MREIADDIIALLRKWGLAIHREGYPFIGIFAGVTLVLGLIWEPLWIPGIVLTLWCIYFFRDPDRVTPVREGLVIAPADGRIQSIGIVRPPEDIVQDGTEMLRISIFMNVFDVHVNRAPLDATLIDARYRPGKFLNASLDKASVDNERMSLLMETPGGKAVGVVQIAGLIARRIVCDVKPGDHVRAGQRFGMIRFGSRVDVYLPRETVPLVCENQRSVAGETVLADISKERRGREAPRTGEIR